MDTISFIARTTPCRLTALFKASDVTAEDPDWPPSPAHLAYHEAGHAVLLDACGQTVRYIAIEPDTAGLASFTKPNEETGASQYGNALINGERWPGPRPPANDLGEFLRILVAGDAAAHIWSDTEDDGPAIVATWQSALHDEQNRADPRHREIRQACLVSTRFFDGNIEQARDFVIKQTERAREVLQERWPAVQALASELLADYCRARVLERSAAPVSGVLLDSEPTTVIHDALLRIAGKHGLEERP